MVHHRSSLVKVANFWRRYNTYDESWMMDLGENIAARAERRLQCTTKLQPGLPTYPLWCARVSLYFSE